MQAVALGGFIAPFGLLTGALEVPGDIVWWISAVALGVAVVLTITSGLEFARDVVRHRRGAPASALTRGLSPAALRSGRRGRSRGCRSRPRRTAWTGCGTGRRRRRRSRRPHRS